jgi:hypothetical protein
MADSNELEAESIDPKDGNSNAKGEVDHQILG